jgi:hypothetical protein
MHNKYHKSIYITTMFPCIIYNSTCFNISCHQQGVTYLTLWRRSFF